MARDRDTPISPNACGLCDVDREEHLNLWHPDGPGSGWHQWIEPTDEQRKQRTLARRAA